MPNTVERVWWDGDESLVILGSDNRWYDVYPTYGDSYMVDCEADKLAQSYVENIEQAYINNQIEPRVYKLRDDRDGKLLIVDETPEQDDFERKITDWLKPKGFAWCYHYDFPDNATWIYNGEYGDDSQNPEMLARVSKMKDVTNLAKAVFRFSQNRSPKRASLDILNCLKGEYSGTNGIRPGVTL